MNKKSNGHGFLQLPREYFNTSEWGRPRVFSHAEAWLSILELAAFAPGDRLVQGKFISVGVGEFVASERFFSERWTWSRTKVRAYLSYLKSNHRITQRKDQGETIIIVGKHWLPAFWADQKEPAKEPAKEPEKNQRSYQRRTSDHTSEEPAKDQREYSNKGNMGNNGDKGNNGRKIQTAVCDADVREIWDFYNNKKDGLKGKDAVRKALGMKGVTVETLKAAITDYDRHLEANPWKKKMNAQGYFNQQRFTAEYSPEDFVNRDTPGNALSHDELDGTPLEF